jgi:calpain
MLVALMQKDRRGMGLKNHGIGYVIYQMGPPGSAPKPLPNNFFQGSKVAESTDEYKRRRENSKRVRLPPGTYCLVPTTYEKDEEADFIIRVFSEKSSGVSEHDVDDVKLLESEEVQSAPPEFEDPTVELGLEQLFERYAKDEEIGAQELKQILDIGLRTEFQFNGFSIEVCRSMVATMDFDLSGKLGLDEFLSLWKNILAWKDVFLQHDVDRSGSLDPSELRNALNKAGFPVNLRVLKLLVRRYGSQDGNLLFDDFILFLVRLKTMLEIFKEKSDVNNKATFELSEWLEKAMYC